VGQKGKIVHNEYMTSWCKFSY